MLNAAAPKPDAVSKNTTRLLKLKPGQSIYLEGDAADCWFVVRSGVVRTCRFYSHGERHVLQFFYPGDAFGLARPSREESAEAVNNLELRRYMATSGEAAGEVNNEDALQAALHMSRDCLCLLGHRTAEQRLAAFLLALADRGGTIVGVHVPMPRADIGDHLRLTIHTVSRTLSNFTQRNLIALRGPQTIDIIDEAKLRRLAAGDRRGR